MIYIIISLKHGNGKSPMFWRDNNAGYTYSPFAAGKYSKEQVESDPGYYNNGHSTIAVPLTDQAMEQIGFVSKYNTAKLESFYYKKKEESKINP